MDFFFFKLEEGKEITPPLKKKHKTKTWEMFSEYVRCWKLRFIPKSNFVLLLYGKKYHLSLYDF